jgi:cytochrome b561
MSMTFDIPADVQMSPVERFLASSSEKLLYTLMVAMPLIGWGMLSAGHYPIVMWGSVHLPPILPAHPLLYAFLRHAHTVLAYLFFATILAHLGAVLFHNAHRPRSHFELDGRLAGSVGHWSAEGSDRRKNDDGLRRLKRRRLDGAR